MPARPRNAYLILGLVRRGATTGYTIKAVVDTVARYFWAVSYGQLYPELKRLERDGLLTSETNPSEGRRRTFYAITGAGEQELEAWLDSPDELQYELRAEGFMKLILAEDAEQQRQILRQLRAEAQQGHDAVAATDPPRVIGQRIRLFGLQHYEALVAWCDDTERLLPDVDVDG